MFGIIPFVQRRRRIQTLVALQPDETAVQGAGQDLGHLGFADTGFPLEKQRLVQAKGQVHGGGEFPVAHIFVVGQQPLNDFNGFGHDTIKVASAGSGVKTGMIFLSH